MAPLKTENVQLKLKSKNTTEELRAIKADFERCQEVF